MSSKYGECLDQIQNGTIITMTLTPSGNLIISMGQQILLDDFANGLPNHIYPIFDLYGKCEKISICNNDVKNGSPINEDILMSTTSMHPASGATAITTQGVGVGGVLPINNNCILTATTATINEIEQNVPLQCEKGDLEVHEKETEIPSSSSSAIVMITSGGNNTRATSAM